MQSCIWLLSLFLVLILFLEQRKGRLAAIMQIRNRKNHQKENKAMQELAKQFIGKECILYTITGLDSGIKGTIREVSDGGIILEKRNGIEAVNLEYVTRILELPRSTRSKKKQLPEQ